MTVKYPHDLVNWEHHAVKCAYNLLNHVHNLVIWVQDFVKFPQIFRWHLQGSMVYAPLQLKENSISHYCKLLLKVRLLKYTVNNDQNICNCSHWSIQRGLISSFNHKLRWVVDVRWWNYLLMFSRRGPSDCELRLICSEEWTCLKQLLISRPVGIPEKCV